MTTSKWVGALAVMMIVIFGLTFVLNYTSSGTQSDGGSESDATANLATLDFQRKTEFPYMTEGKVPMGTFELEFRKPGHQDYPFINNNDEAVRVGAIAKSCKCQGVEIYVLPYGERVRPSFPAPHPICSVAMGSLGWSALQSYIDAYDASNEQDAQSEHVFVLNSDDATAVAEVPPHREGWVRMKWTGEKFGKMNLTAKLWLNHKDSGLDVDFSRLSNFVEPVILIGNDAAIGNVKVKELPRTVYFYVWSWTRRSFNITKKSVIHPAGQVGSADAFEIGEAVPLTASQCAAASSSPYTRVWSGYRIPVTLKKAASDGSLCEVGNFRRRVEIATDASDKPLTMTFGGVVSGEMRISNVDDSGGINFGSFRRDNLPPSRSVFIQSPTADLKLEVDEKRTPEYLRASLSKQPTVTEQFSSWKLEVKVLPSVYGQFPREEDAAYRDGAIYVHTVGNGPRQTIRIAVRGDAGNG
jgi:hypothetical protein